MPYMQNCNAGNHTGRLTADSTAAPTNRPGNNTLVPHPADYAAARRRRGRPGPGPGAARMPHIALDINPALHIPPLPECRATPREWLDVSPGQLRCGAHDASLGFGRRS